MNAIDILTYGQRTVIASLDGIPDETVDQPGACGVWSVKDIVAHLASYELVLVDVLRSEAGERGDRPYLDRFIALRDGFNDAEVDDRKLADIGAVRVELTTAHGDTLRLAAAIPATRLSEVGTMPWYGAEYAIDDLIVYQYYGHKREHSAQIEAFRDHGPHAG